MGSSTFQAVTPAGPVVFPAGWRHEAALRHITAGGLLVDLGCDDGRVSAAVASRFATVIGVDHDPGRLAIAASRGIDTVLADITDPLPFDDGAADAALCLEVVEHVPRPDLLIAEITRVLAPGGHLYLSTPNVRHVRHLYELVVRGRFPLTSSDPRGFQGGHVHFFTWRDAEALLDGLRLVKRVPLPLGRRLRELLAPGIFLVAEKG